MRLLRLVRLGDMVLQGGNGRDIHFEIVVFSSCLCRTNKSVALSLPLSMPMKMSVSTSM